MTIKLKTVPSDCAPAAAAHSITKILPNCGSVNNTVLEGHTTPINLYGNMWQMAHLEKGTSLVSNNTSSKYVTLEVFNKFKDAQQCSSWGALDSNIKNEAVIVLWTDSWWLLASIDTRSDQVSFSYVHVKGTEPFKELFSHLQEDASGSYVKWFYRNSNNEICDTHMKLKGNLPRNEFYPDIEDLHELYNEFVESPANVLLLVGPPGTGKTTFLRGLLQHCDMNAWITYDPSIQQDESFTIQFADPGATESRVLVLEDCDTLMESRTEGNSLMNRILNLSDGIVELPKRKLIFSTNLPNLSSVDSALLRPGRCFGAIRFRKLEPSEATKAALSVGLKRSFTESVTLAEAINANNGTNNVVRHIGF